MKEIKKLVLNDMEMSKEQLKHLLGGFSEDVMPMDYNCEGASPCQDGCKEGCKDNCKKNCQTGKK